MIFCAEVFVSVVFERGNFTRENVEVVSNCLKLLGFALPFVVYMKIFSSIFFSHENTKTPMYIALVCTLINGAISLILMPFLGIYGIIIGTATSYVADTIITFVLLLRKNLIKLNFREVFNVNIKILLAGFIFGLFCWFFFAFYSKTSYYENIFEHSLLIKFLYLAVLSVAGVIIYYIALRLFGIDVKKLVK